jgi:hypothetical protein
MNFLWISGWAVPPAWLAAEARAVFPDAQHAAVSPSAAATAVTQKNFNVLGGYSLGALWVLMHAQDFPATMPVILLAPFFSFAAENGDGGRIARAQLRLQRRRFRQDPAAAIVDFYRRSGLKNVPHSASYFTPEKMAEFDMELDWLESWQAPVPAPKHWVGFVGDSDPLLDAEKLREKWPAVQVVSNAGHAPGPLLCAAAKEFKTKASR